MSVINFFTSEPTSIPGDARLYELRPFPHATQKHGLPAPLDAVQYAVEGSQSSAEAVLSLPVEGQVMFERPGAGPGRGGVLRLLLNVRRPDLTRDQFADHWRKVHAPLAIGRNPRYDYYVTNIVIDPASVWDGVLQEWFPDEGTFATHESGLRDVKKAVADDYALFLADSAECPQWLATEISRQP